jgi:membrane fusion protein, multidrug efflux system
MSPALRRIIISAVILGGIGLLLWPKFKPQEEPAGSGPGTLTGQQDSRLAVNTFIAVPELIRDRIYTTGTILPNEIVDLATETSGKVVALYFKEGRSVQKGDLLLKINDSELQAQLRSAELRLELAQDIEKRQRSLLEKQGLSQAEYDVSDNDLSVQQVTIDLIRAQIDKTELRAPFSGIIGLRYVSEGSYVTSATRIATLQDIDPIKIEFSIPERHANRAGVGDVIFFTVEGHEETHRGEIYALEPLIRQDTRSLRLRARSSNQGTRLIPGSFANVELIFQEIADAISVPTVAIIPELGGTKVYLYRSGSVVPAQVVTGIRLQNTVQVVSGLATGDTVITSGIQQVFPGMPVRLAGESVNDARRSVNVELVEHDAARKGIERSEGSE